MEDSGVPSDFKQRSNTKEHSVNLVKNELERSIGGNGEVMVVRARTMAG